MERAGIANGDRAHPRPRRVDIHTARPGIVIGAAAPRPTASGWVSSEKLTGKQVQLNIPRGQEPEIDAQLVAQGVAEQLQPRAVPRAMRKGPSDRDAPGAMGIRIQCPAAWRRDVAHRSSTARAASRCTPAAPDIDYGFYEAHHLRPHRREGLIYKGEVAGTRAERQAQAAARAGVPGRGGRPRVVATA